VPNWTDAFCHGGPGETSKAYRRRLRDGWFETCVRLDRPGLDVGCGRDPLCVPFRRYDQIFGDGDVTTLADVPGGLFWTVYASHVLEHVHDPGLALENWYRVLAPGGLLLVSVPHRDLYERRLALPSRWNGDHKTFWLPDGHEPPVTRGLHQTLREAIPQAELISFCVCAEGYFDPGPDKHAHGEFSIEAVLHKPEG
jgi:SAM-dependent methyltransferase